MNEGKLKKLPVQWSTEACLSFQLLTFFYVNIIKDDGKNGNILLITRKQSSKGVMHNKCIYKV